MKTALTIAGSDSSGGAGIQADIKTMTANGVYAMSAITALTAQNTTGVQGIFEVTPEFPRHADRQCIHGHPSGRCEDRNGLLCGPDRDDRRQAEALRSAECCGGPRNGSNQRFPADLRRTQYLY